MTGIVTLVASAVLVAVGLVLVIATALAGGRSPLAQGYISGALIAVAGGLRLLPYVRAMRSTPTASSGERDDAPSSTPAASSGERDDAPSEPGGGA